jgi:P-type Cu2+ transporter
MATTSGQQDHHEPQDRDAQHDHGGSDHGDHGHGHDHSEHHRQMIRDFRRRFYVSLVASVPVILLSAFVQEIFGFALSVPGERWLVPALGTFIFLYGGWPFLTGLVQELRERQPGMMTLIGLAITVAWGFSMAVSAGFPGRPFFWELATLIDVMLAGHWLEMRSVVQASSALEELSRLIPDTAHRKDGETVQDVPVDDLVEGDVVLVRPGETIPADGRIVSGASDVDESLITGEAEPVTRAEGDEVIGGSLNGDAALEVEIEKTGEGSYLSQVVELVNRAQAESSRTQALSDRAAVWLTVIAITAGIVTLGAWLAAGRDAQFAISRMATVMVITCPHALGLAIPLVVSVSTTRAARHGLLIRDRTAFENARRVDTVVFDKTGTLTEGRFVVQGIDSHDDTTSPDTVLALAAAVERQSEHPIARGIRERAEQDGVTVASAEGVESRPGRGVSGTVDGREVHVVSPGDLVDRGFERPESEDDEQGAAITRVHVIADDRLLGSIALADRVRETAASAVRALQERGIACRMLTGDNEATARAVAEELQLDGYHANVEPADKESHIAALQEEGRFVAMTGDGVNDSPALARADVGIAVGSGTDVAAASADIVLVESDPRDITSLILFGRATYRKMVQNLWYASGYNIIAIPLAAGALASVGVILSPAVGALLMSLSTVVVAINARLLRVPELAS